MARVGPLFLQIMTAATWIFWISAAVICYTLVGYPLLAVVLAAAVQRRTQTEPIALGVTFIIAAYNEQGVIAEKLDQTLALDYPRDRLEIVVASDGSTDATDDIVRRYADRGVRLYRCEDRRGKTHTLNQAVNTASGEILVFSDATGVFSRDAIRRMAAHFADPTVGCVAGRVAYRYGDDVTSRGFRFYQRLAVAVRRAESRWGSETSVSGSIHAMRRLLYRPSDPAFSLDVINAVHTVAAGYRVAYEYDAVSVEQSRTRLADEFRARVRIGVRGTCMMPYILRTLVRPFRSVYLFQMVSHKFLRWWLWFFLLAMLVANMVLCAHNPAYRWPMFLQLGAYFGAMFALLLGSRGVRIPGLSGAGLFLLGNAAMAVGAIKALLGRRMAKWEPVR